MMDNNLLASICGQHPARTLPFDELYNGLQEAIQKGYVNVVTDGELELFNYTPSCTYEKAWNIFTLISRGLILCPSKKIVVATPFPKFFNYGESVYLPNDGFTVTEKMDGSMGIIYFWNGVWRVATRGSLNSDQAQWAQGWLYKNCDLSLLEAGTTYLSEIVYPENRIVITYNWSGLVLLGAYDCNGFEIADVSMLNEFAVKINFRRPKVFSENAIDKLLDCAKILSHDEEGFVVRFNNGYRVKIKGDQYCRIHALISRCTPLAVWEAMRNCDDLTEIRKQLPEEFSRDYNELEKIFANKFNSRMEGIKVAYEKTKHLSDKELGLLLASPTCEIAPEIRRFIFPCRKNDFLTLAGNAGKLRGAIFDGFRPTANYLEGYIPSNAMNRFAQNDEG